MRTSTAYFVGAGTVIVAIVAGLGGGLLIANIVSPTPAKQGIEVSLMERRKASEPVPVKAGASEPVQYLAAPSLPVPAASAPVPAQPAPQTEAVNSAPSAIPPAAVAAAAPVAQEPRPVASQDTRPVASPDTFAKAQDADIKRDTEVKRSVEKRRAERERRQQWADKRRFQQRQDQELRDVEDKVRDETEPRRQSAIEPVRIEAPQIRLFGPE